MIVQTRKKPPRLQNRRTPRWLFEQLDVLFGPFALDAFADQRNALLPRFYTKRDDGSRAPWLDVTFANPPFAIMGNALVHAVEQMERCRSCIVGPIGGAQEWMHAYAIRGTIWLPDSRISYDLPNGRPTKGADRDSMVVTLGGEHYNPGWRRGIFRVRRLPIDVR